MEAEAEPKIQEVFNKLPPVASEIEAKRVTTQTEQSIKECKYEITEFIELNSSALSKVPELGPLVGQSEETKTMSTSEADRPMEAVATGKD